MSEKPFWAGKTLMEIQNLDKRVKVTMENGDVFIGKLVRRSRDTDGICSLSMQLDAHRTYLHVLLYSEDLLLAAFKPVIDEHDRQIAEQAWENGYIQALKNMNPMPGEEPPEYTPNPYRKENA